MALLFKCRCKLLYSSALFRFIRFQQKPELQLIMAPGLQALASSFNKLVASDDKVASIKDSLAAASSSAGKTMAAPHPLDALSPDEIAQVGTAVRKYFTEVS